MKLSTFATACSASLAFAQAPTTALTTETIYSCPSNATEYFTITVSIIANSTVSQAAAVPTINSEVAFPHVPTTYPDSPVHPVTIVHTVTATIFKVSVSTAIPAPITQTSTATRTTSETFYPIIATWTTQEEETSLTICPTRTLNPTYTAQFPLPTEYTWGCPPGYLCKPDQINCNFEAGLPAENFYCSPDQCIVASPLGVPQQWDTSIYGNSTPAVDPSLRIDAIGHYFNMDPRDYGLTYGIFLEEEAFTFTSTVGYGPTPAVAARQAQTSVPGTCYPWCNDCLLEAQSMGKTPALCAPDSTYEKDLTNCQQCISYHASDSSESFVQIAPQFQQFLAYCNALSTSTSSKTPLITVYSTFTVEPDLTTSTIVESGLPSSTKASLATTIASRTSPVVSQASAAKVSITEWIVSSGSSSVVFHTSPTVTTQWTVTTGTSTMTFASSPIISASIISNGTSTLSLLATSRTTSSVVSSTIALLTSTENSASTNISRAFTFLSSSASPTFTGAASRNTLPNFGVARSLFLMLCAGLVVTGGDW